MVLLWLLHHSSTHRTPAHRTLHHLPSAPGYPLTLTFPSCDAYAPHAPDVLPFHAFTHARSAPLLTPTTVCPPPRRCQVRRRLKVQRRYPPDLYRRATRFGVEAYRVCVPCMWCVRGEKRASLLHLVLTHFFFPPVPHHPHPPRTFTYLPLYAHAHTSQVSWTLSASSSAAATSTSTRGEPMCPHCTLPRRRV